MKQLPEVNQDIRSRLKNITCFALDMDGTVYLGTKWIEGAVDFLKAVEKAGKQYIFLTNNSSKGPENYVEKLAAMGLIVTKDRIVTSGQATISYLKKHYPGKRVYLLGNELLQREFQEEGILLAEKTGEALRNVKFDICFTSPLSRAKQTAEYVLGKRDVPIIPDKRIQEIDFGVLEGRASLYCNPSRLQLSYGGWLYPGYRLFS